MFHLTLSSYISNIFEGFCILKREVEEIKCLYSFPTDYSFQKFYDFIFPCDCSKDRSEEYCIVISNPDRSFLLCRYLHGEDDCNLYLCLYSFNPWFEIFSKLLYNLIQFDFMPDRYECIGAYLEQIYVSKGDAQLTTVTLPACHGNDNTPQSILISSLNFPYIYDKYIQEYLTAINPRASYNKQLWLEVFCSMLLERPIIFMSKRFQKLTSSLLAATFFIHPLSWAHKFISIVPRKSPQLLGMNCCMLGIHSCMEPSLDKIDFWNEALLVDLDSGDSRMVGASDDEKETRSRFKVPKCIKKFFINHVQLVDDSLSSNKPQKVKDLISNTPWNINAEEVMYNDYKHGFHGYSLLFRTIVALLIGNYRQFISLNDGCYEFEKETFIEHNPKLSDFLRNFVQSQCFFSFIDEKLQCIQNSRDMNDRFDRERLEITYKTKNKTSKNKENKLFRKTSPIRSVKTNSKVDRFEKISTMPNPQKPKQVRTKHSLTVFHVKSPSLSSSATSISSNESRENTTDSDSFKCEIMRGLADRGIILDNACSKKLSTISSHTISDHDDILITPTADKNTRHGFSLQNCSLSKSEDVLLRVPPPRPTHKPGETPSGQLNRTDEQTNDDKVARPPTKITRSKPVSRVKSSDLLPPTKPVSLPIELFEPKEE